MKKTLMIAAVAGLASVTLADTYSGGSTGPVADATGNNNQASATLSTFTLVVSNPANPTITSFNALNLGINHTWVGDLLIQLTSPSGTTADVLVRPGVTTATSFGSSSDFLAANTYAFVNSGGTAFPTGSAASVASGTYNRLGRAAAGQVASDSGLDFTAFNGQDLNGTWTLSIRDYGSGDTGSINGWSMDISSVPTPGAAAMLGLGGLASFRRRRA